MADVKMNQFPTASDGSYIYAEAADGTQVRISKADLASVVAGLIGYRNHYFTVPAGVSVLVTSNEAYYGLLSSYRALASSYGLFNIYGYGVSSTRNNVSEITSGVNCNISFSYSDTARGFIITNNGTNTAMLNLVLWEGGDITVTTI